MKLAFFDTLQVGGGLSRFALLLAKNLVEVKNDLQIDYYVHHNNLKNIPEIKNIDRVKVIKLKDTENFSIVQKIKLKIGNKFGISFYKTHSQIINEILKSENFDLAYFPSAHMMEKPISKKPIVGTIHDFNWKYFFGRQIFNLDFIKIMDVEVVKWMQETETICSAQDVVNEAKMLFPNCSQYPTVIPITSAVVNTGLSRHEAEEILKSIGVNFPYIIFPGNFFPHKNHLNLFIAFSILKEKDDFKDYKLILTGMNSDQLPKGLACKRGVKIVTNDRDHFDIIGMGYQSNKVMDALIMMANLLVSPSIYEAICTPAMDAWSFGTPTAIANIPPFKEHESRWCIKSAFFDPINPHNIAEVLEQYLKDNKRRLNDGKVSKINIEKYSWDVVAKAYLSVFQKAIKM